MATAPQTNEFETSTGVLWDDPEAGKTWTASLMGVTILTALVVALSVMYFSSEQREVEAKVIAPEYLALKELKSSQLDLLASRGAYAVEVNGVKAERNRIPVGDAIVMMSQNPSLAAPDPAAKPAPAPSAPAPAVAKP
ncbi:MAG: hypothetical protein FJ260_01760 [Planctomycetes bacterium]|nr:hypothetical protein [Planctomycetota bacterium]